MGRVTNFFNCNILRDGKIVHDNLWVRGGAIVDPQAVQFTADTSIDCKGAIICPSFIDIKLNGAVGVYFSNPDHLTEEKLNKVRAYLPYTGVTLFCPTIETTTPEMYRKILPKLKVEPADSHKGAGMLGVHLDGPFISVMGAHKSELLQQFGENPGQTIKDIYGEDVENVAIVTMAPELPKSDIAIKHLTRLGIKVSIGHSKAKIDEAENAVKNGASMISHLFNAMPDFHHRDPGVVGLVSSPLANENLRFAIIADRFHVHPATLRMAYRIAPQALMLCTDGQAPLGLGPGIYDFAGQEIEVDEADGISVCYKRSTNAMYGSVCPFHRAVKNLQTLTECDLAFALEAGSKKPAQTMGLWPKKGSMQFGADADFVILEQKSLNLAATFIAGCKVADNNLIEELEVLPLTCVAPEYYSPSQKKNSLPEVPERVQPKRRKSVTAL